MIGLDEDYLPDEVVIPLYNISPEEIFKGEVELFDVNFFDPDSEYHVSGTVYTLNSNYTAKTRKYTGLTSPVKNTFGVTLSMIESGTKIAFYSLEQIEEMGIVESGWFSDETNTFTLYEYTYPDDEDKYENAGETWYFLVGKNGTNGTEVVGWNYNPIEDDVITTETSISYYALSYSLSSVVSKWYYILLRMGIIAMMSILVYIGIRILLSSVASEKAKYKQMLGDWFVGMILLFSMHYIMVLANIFNDSIIEFVENSTVRFYMPSFVFEEDSDKYDKLVEGLEAYNIEICDDINYFLSEYAEGELVAYEAGLDDGRVSITICTDMMGAIRMNYAYAQDTDDTFIGYAVMFIVMTIFTVMYAVIYFKRVILMAFLTMIAPLVAVTYPLDKANDGKAQGFDMWFKEYIFNLLLQPMHLLLYVILIGSATEVATENFIWCIMCMLFMTQGEEILRRLFNFQKAQTPGGLKGALATGAVMTGMQKLFGHTPPGGKGDQSSGSSSGSGSAGSSSGKHTKIKMSALYGATGGSSGTTTGNSSGVTGGSSGTITGNSSGATGGSSGTTTGNSSGATGGGSGTTTGNSSGIPGGSSGSASGNTTGSKKNTEPRKLRRLASLAGHNVKNRAKRTIKNAPKNILKLAYAGTIGTAGAMVGMAAGVASGDLSKVGSYTAAGALAGGKYGSKLGNIQVDSNGDLKRAWQGNAKYNEKETEKRIKEMAENAENIRMAQKKAKDEEGKHIEMTMGETEKYLKELGEYFDKIQGYTKDASNMVKLDNFAKTFQKNGISVEKSREYAIAADKMSEIAKGEDKDAEIEAIMNRWNIKDKTQATNLWQNSIDFQDFE